ncbi:divalent metal cation transporter [Paraburkholderia youngii]|uniref:divalent metal cation transporter n=1 Tax=Paraburkholderia youngii TaxID=2782701 RepID=UPI003D19DEF1
MGLLSTAAQGGAAFRFQLAWPIVVGTVCIVFLTEMSGRFAAVSSHTIADGIRDRFGIKFFRFPLRHDAHRQRPGAVGGDWRRQCIARTGQRGKTRMVGPAGCGAGMVCPVA